MLYWKNVPPAIALSYFYKEYASHPITAKFAAKTLQRFKPVSHITYVYFVNDITVLFSKLLNSLLFQMLTAHDVDSWNQIQQISVFVEHS